eukprot:1829051-Pyramimonas_sp.AAC.1
MSHNMGECDAHFVDNPHAPRRAVEVPDRTCIISMIPRCLTLGLAIGSLATCGRPRKTWI